LKIQEKGHDSAFTIWYSLSLKKIIQVQYPEDGLFINLLEKDTKEQKRIADDPAEDIKEVIYFSNKKKITAYLKGPKNKGELPVAIILRSIDDVASDQQIMFSVINETLSNMDVLTLTIDMNPQVFIGKGKGISIEEQFVDISKAIDLLSEYRFVDPAKIFIISHGSANYVIPAFLKTDERICGAIMISANREDPIINFKSDSVQKQINSRNILDNEYKHRILIQRENTLSVVEKNIGQSKFLMGEFVYTKRMKELLSAEFFPL